MMSQDYIRMLREASKRKLQEKREERLAKAASRPCLEEKSGEASVQATPPESRAPEVTFAQTYAEMRAKVAEEKRAAPPSLGSISERGHEFVQEEISTAVRPSVEEEEVPMMTAPALRLASEAGEAVDKVIQRITEQIGGEDDVMEIVPPVEAGMGLWAGPSFDLVEKEVEVQETLPQGEAVAEEEAQTGAPIDVLDTLLALKAVGHIPTVIPGPDTNLSLCTPPHETPTSDSARVDPQVDPMMAMLQSLTQSMADLTQRVRSMEEVLLAQAKVPASSTSAPVDQTNFRTGVRFFHDLLVRRGIVSPDVFQNDEAVKYLLWFLNL